MFPKLIKSQARWEGHCALRTIHRSWDLMPPEMVLPLASSRLGDIVVLAHRLGMRWRDISHRELLADGNGQVLSSTEARGLGLILKYDCIDKINPTDELIPCVANDKLRCGIMPGWRLPCFDDYQSDLQLNGDDGQPTLLLDHLTGVTPGARKLLETMLTPSWDRNRHYWSAVNDWISVRMSCDFLPLPDWSYRRIVWPFPDERVGSILGSPECWILLNEEMRRLGKEGDPGVDHVMSRTDKLFVPLTKSLCEHLQNIVDTFSQIPRGYADRPQAKLETRQWLRRMFDETSEVFGGLSNHADPRVIRMRNPYRVLVDAHLSLAIQNADETLKIKNTFRPSNAVRNILGCSTFRCKLLQLCVERRRMVVDHFKISLANIAIQLDDAQIEGLWWVLMLRSICWWLSVEVECRTSNIPSHYYYSQLPVYLT